MNDIMKAGYIPKWRQTLKDVCPEADINITELKESTERWRHWVIKQNAVIDKQRIEINELREKIFELEIAQDDERCFEVAEQAYLSEVVNCENNNTEPF